MFAAIANVFGYILNFIYNLLNNYGLSIILFSILVKILLLPLTIKQQKTMEKTNKIQDEIKSLQFKYKNDQEKMNQEMMAVYKRENMSPFSGCLSSIVQLILILAVFYLVRSPLTYMKKVDVNLINEYTTKLEQKTSYPEVEIIKEFGNQDETVYINMNFLGLDLSSVPTANLKDFKTLVIPILYVISSIVSMKLTLNTQNNKKKIKKEDEDKEKKEEEDSMQDVLQSQSKTMTYMMPVMAFSISLIAPLGLALYWLMNNLLMIVERVLINKIISKKGEEA